MGPSSSGRPILLAYMSPVQGLVGTSERVCERLEEFAAVGVDLVLLQCSPQAEEMERSSAQVIRPALDRAPENA